MDIEDAHSLHLPELECDTPELVYWAPLRTLAQEAAAVQPPLQSPPSALNDMAVKLLWKSEADAEHLGAFWQRRGGGTFPFGRYCILGHFTALYVLAWSAASGEEPQQPTALNYLRKANKLLRMDDHDLLDHTSWPFSSWDLLCNLYAVMHGKLFLPRWTRVAPSPEISQQLPLVWPSFSLPSWPMAERRDHGITGRNSHTKKHKQLSVWWTSKHPGPFVDIVTIMDRFMGDSYDMHVHSHAVSEYCRYPLYRDWLCSNDEKFAEDVLWRSFVQTHKSQAECGEDKGQWCGLRQLHEEFDEAVNRFDSMLGKKLANKIDLFMCGHPLYWCRLFERMDVPVLGVWEMSHHFAVPEALHDQWNHRFLSMFTKKQNLLVAFCAFHSFQAQWLLGIRVPYYPPIALHVALTGRYMPIHNDSVLLSVFNTPYDVQLIQRLAASIAGYPLRLLAWPDDVPCGTDCPKGELARFRAVVLCAYDTSTLKLAEFYAMHVPIFIHRAGLWRTGMRWAKAAAREAGSNASWYAKSLDLPPGLHGWAQLVDSETRRMRWQDPWQASQAQRLRSLGSSEARRPGLDTAIAYFLDQQLCFQNSSRLMAVTFAAQRADDGGQHANSSDASLSLLIYRPVDLEVAFGKYVVLAEDAEPQVTKSVGSPLWGDGVAFRVAGGIEVQPGDCVGWHTSSERGWRIPYDEAGHPVLLRYGGSIGADEEFHFNMRLERTYSIQALVQPFNVHEADTVRSASSGGSSASTDLLFAPYTVDREELHPAGAAFWSQLTDWNLRKHLLPYDSAGHLLLQLRDMSQEDLLAVSEKMAVHYVQLQNAVINFWRALIVSVAGNQDASEWRGEREIGETTSHCETR